LSENPISVCPEFEAGRIDRWLEYLPDEVVYTEDGWIAVELELDRVDREIAGRFFEDCDKLFARQDELSLHPLRRGVPQGSGLPW
jgi:hypothetical protein